MAKLLAKSQIAASLAETVGITKKQAAQTMFSIPGNPAIPTMVRGYGTVIRVASVMVFILVAVALLLLFIERAQQSPVPSGTIQIDVMSERENIAVLVLISSCILSSLLFPVGKLVRNGHKTGIHALTALATLGVIGGFIPAVLTWQSGWIIAMVTVGAVAIGLVPPIVVGHKHWEKFH